MDLVPLGRKKKDLVKLLYTYIQLYHSMIPLFRVDF